MNLVLFCESVQKCKYDHVDNSVWDGFDCAEFGLDLVDHLLLISLSAELVPPLAFLPLSIPQLAEQQRLFLHFAIIGEWIRTPHMV